MIKLNQIIAIEKGLKNRTTRVETDLYHDLSKMDTPQRGPLETQ